MLKSCFALVIILGLGVRTSCGVINQVAGCGSDQLACVDPLCVLVVGRCDNFPDCLEGSDHACSLIDFCSGGRRSCLNGDCIPGHLFCDGTPNCPDGSDEMCGLGGGFHSLMGAQPRQELFRPPPPHPVTLRQGNVVSTPAAMSVTENGGTNNMPVTLSPVNHVEEDTPDHVEPDLVTASTNAVKTPSITVSIVPVTTTARIPTDTSAPTAFPPRQRLPRTPAPLIPTEPQTQSPLITTARGLPPTQAPFMPTEPPTPSPLLPGLPAQQLPIEPQTITPILPTTRSHQVPIEPETRTPILPPNRSQQLPIEPQTRTPILPPTGSQHLPIEPETRTPMLPPTRSQQLPIQPQTPAPQQLTSVMPTQPPTPPPPPPTTVAPDMPPTTIQLYFVQTNNTSTQNSNEATRQPSDSLTTFTNNIVTVLPLAAPTSKPTTVRAVWVKLPTTPPQEECYQVEDYGYCRKNYRGYFMHPLECQKFIVCEWGLQYVCRCPNETLWEQRSRTCVWEADATCYKPPEPSTDAPQVAVATSTTTAIHNRTEPQMGQQSSFNNLARLLMSLKARLGTHEVRPASGFQAERVMGVPIPTLIREPEKLLFLPPGLRLHGKPRPKGFNSKHTGQAHVSAELPKSQTVL